jgi:hypothetical protein
MKKKSNGIRWLLINALNREQLIDFIKRKESTFDDKSLENYSSDQLRDIAQIVDLKVQNLKMEKKARQQVEKYNITSP